MGVLSVSLSPPDSLILYMCPLSSTMMKSYCNSKNRNEEIAKLSNISV